MSCSCTYFITIDEIIQFKQGFPKLDPIYCCLQLPETLTTFYLGHLGIEIQQYLGTQLQEPLIYKPAVTLVELGPNIAFTPITHLLLSVAQSCQKAAINKSFFSDFQTWQQNDQKKSYSWGGLLRSSCHFNHFDCLNCTGSSYCMRLQQVYCHHFYRMDKVSHAANHTQSSCQKTAMMKMHSKSQHLVPCYRLLNFNECMLPFLSQYKVDVLALG